MTTLGQPLTPDTRSSDAREFPVLPGPSEPTSQEPTVLTGATAGPPPPALPTSVSQTTIPHHDPTSATSSGKATPVQRPTFVRLPTPIQFSMSSPQPVDASPTESIRFPSGEKRTSNLKTFDNNFSNGSPSVSFNAMCIEPDLPVLVVDDDPLTRTLMKRILTRLGCQVSLAENGEVALEMILGQRITMGATPSSDSSGNFGPILEQTQDLRPLDPEGKYAVVFLDNQMPVMSGLKVAGKLRELGRSDFIVGVTGNALLSDQEEYLEAGVDHVLTKPVLERSLRDILVEADAKRKDEKREEQPES